MPGPLRDRGRTAHDHEEEPDRRAPSAAPHEEEREESSDVEGRPGDEALAADEERGLSGASRTGLPADLGEGEVER